MTDRPEQPALGEVEAALLRAARSYAPPPESRERTLAALGLGLPAASLAPGATKAAGWALGWKIGGVCVIAALIGGLVAARMAHVAAPSSSSSMGTPVTSPMSVDTTVPVDVPPPTAAATSTALVAATPSSPVHSSRAASPAPAASSLAEEVRMLDQASASLGAHDASAALTELDAYRAKFPRGSMSLEATVLRIEALRQSGNGPAADALADDFLAKHPTSALASRVRAGKKSGGQ